ncbi:MAG: DUF58 domain-containing protein [Roseobacter sp.]
MTQTPDPRVHVDLAHLRRLKGRARAISFGPGQPSRSILNGQHASKIKGRGLNFEELRHYAMGDDVRTIDWKVTARTGAPYIRVYTEERDRPVLLVVDQRMSMFYGSVLNMKSVTAAEAAALAAFRVHDKGDRVGGIIFDDAGAETVRPHASARALNRFLDRLAHANGALHADAAPQAPMPLSTPLQAAARIVKSGEMVIVFSDFDGWDDKAERHLRRIAQHNQLILFNVADPTSAHLPADMELIASDGDLQARIDLKNANVRQKLEDYSSGRLGALRAFSARYNVPLVPLTSAAPTLPQLLALLGGLRGRR